MCVQLVVPLPSPPSQYNRTDVLPGELYHDTQALEPVWNTLWQLALAGLARGALTVFTYGMKVWGGVEGCWEEGEEGRRGAV